MDVSSKKRKNIILLMTDQQRADHVGWAEGSRVATPNLDRIAQGSAFSRCLTVNPICMPARSALMTGRYTRQIGALSMSGDLDPAIPTYPQALQKAGYRTAAIGKLHLNQSWPWGTQRGCGLNLHAMKERMLEYGFDYLWEVSGKQLAQRNYCDYAHELAEKGLLSAYRDFVASEGPNTYFAADAKFTGKAWPFEEEIYPDVRISDKIVEWLRDRSSDDDTQPFFLLGSFVSPHPPFDPPKRFLEQFPYEEEDDFIHADGEPELDPATRERMWKLRRAYKGMIALVDEQVGRVLDTLEELNQLEQTAILFVSDHGEMLGDHSCIQKSVHWQQSAIVPCAIRHPDYLNASRHDCPVEITDLTATILDVAGLNAQEVLAEEWPAFRDRIPCRSLLPIVRGESTAVRDFAFSEFDNKWSLLHSQRYAYVRYHQSAGQKELFFDLNDDAVESINLVESDSAEVQSQLTKHRIALMNLWESHPPVQSSWSNDFLCAKVPPAIGEQRN